MSRASRRPVSGRYRNFRTFTSPRPTQFSCVAVDCSGEVVSAGAQDSFEVFIWSMQTGRLLDVSVWSGGGGGGQGTWEGASGDRTGGAVASSGRGSYPRTETQTVVSLPVLQPRCAGLVRGVVPGAVFTPPLWTP